MNTFVTPRTVLSFPSISRGKPHEQITAAAVIGERGKPEDARALLPLFTSEYPLVRYWARQAVEDLVKKPLPVNLDGDAAGLPAEAGAWLDRVEKEARRAP